MIDLPSPRYRAAQRRESTWDLVLKSIHPVDTLTLVGFQFNNLQSSCEHTIVEKDGRFWGLY